MEWSEVGKGCVCGRLFASDLMKRALQGENIWVFISEFDGPLAPAGRFLETKEKEGQQVETWGSSFLFNSQMWCVNI